MTDNDYLNLNNYLLSLLEQCESIDLFCQSCYKVLQKYIDVKNIRIAQYNYYRNSPSEDLINYCYHSSILAKEKKDDYLIYLKSLLQSNHEFFNKGISLNFHQHDIFSSDELKNYLNLLNVEEINIFPLMFKKNLLGYLIIENKQNNLIINQEIYSNICRLISKYLALFFYQYQLNYREEEIKKDEQELLENKQQQDKYLSYMNHELRTPITAVIGLAKMLKKQLYGDLNPKQLQYIEAIYDSGNYLLHLVTDLLDIAKIEAKKEELYLEKTAIQELCESSLTLIKPKAEEQGLQINFIINSSINYFFVDAGKIQQILVNLLSNAVKFTEIGSVTLKVEEDGKFINFCVIDTGIGISKLSQEKLFKPFSQINTHLHKKHKGTGLGLTIARELAKLHKGDIIVNSQENKGSCFILSLPLNYEKISDN